MAHQIEGFAIMLYHVL